MMPSSKMRGRAVGIVFAVCAALVWCSSCAMDTGPDTCGDGELSTFEDCEEGDLNGATCSSATDGQRPTGRLTCSDSCSFDTSACLPQTSARPDARPPNDTCPGDELRLTASERTATFTYSTDDLSDDFTPYCAYESGAPDAVFDTLVQYAGTLTVLASSATVVPVIVIRTAKDASDREACDDSAASLLCTVAGQYESALPPKNPNASAAPEVSTDASIGDAGVRGSEGRDASSPAPAEAGSVVPEAGPRDASVGDSGGIAPPKSATAVIAVESGMRLSVIIDGATPAAGTVAVSFDLRDDDCRDGVVNLSRGEECDDQGREDGDGCDHNCKREIPPDDICSSATFLPAALTRGKTMAMEGFTTGATDDYRAPCRGKSGGPDRVYGFVTATGGTLTAKLAATFDGVLSIWKTCDPSARLSGIIACSDGPIASDTEAVVQDIPAGTYYVVVDGFDAKGFGRYELNVGLAE
jgi:hypothetical protein